MKDKMHIVLKGCPRCGGDLIPNGWERDGRSMSCLQCGAEFAGAYARATGTVAGPARLGR